MGRSRPGVRIIKGISSGVCKVDSPCYNGGYVKRDLPSVQSPKEGPDGRPYHLLVNIAQPLVLCIHGLVDRRVLEDPIRRDRCAKL